MAKLLTILIRSSDVFRTLNFQNKQVELRAARCAIPETGKFLSQVQASKIQSHLSQFKVNRIDSDRETWSLQDLSQK